MGDTFNFFNLGTTYSLFCNLTAIKPGVHSMVPLTTVVVTRQAARSIIPCVVSLHHTGSSSRQLSSFERVFILALCTHTPLPAQLYGACSMVVKGLKSFLHDNGEIFQSAKCRLHPRGEDQVSFIQLPGLAPHPRAHYGRSRVATTDCLFYNMIEISCNEFHLLSVGEQDNTIHLPKACVEFGGKKHRPQEPLH